MALKTVFSVLFSDKKLKQTATPCNVYSTNSGRFMGLKLKHKNYVDVVDASSFPGLIHTEGRKGPQRKKIFLSLSSVEEVLKVSKDSKY